MSAVRWVTVVVASIVVAVYLVVVLSTPEAVTRGMHTEIAYLHRAVLAMLAGGRPYIDFPLQYPPLVLLPAVAPVAVSLGAALGEFDLYGRLFGVLMTAATAGVVIGVPLLARRLDMASRAIAATVIVGIAAMTQFLLLPFRYDALPTLLSMGAAATYAAGRSASSGALVATATATKLYPILYLPYFLAGVWRPGPNGPRLLVGFGLVALLVLAPFALIAPLAPFAMLGDQLGRGLQVESTYASVVLLASLVDGELQTTLPPDGAWEVVGPLADVFVRLQPAVLVLVVGGVVAIVARRLRASAAVGTHRGQIAFGIAAIIVAFLVTNRVLSPQHLFWVAPFVALSGRSPALTYLMAMLMTMLIYPPAYGLLLEGEALGVLLVVGRNVLLIVLLGLLLAGGRLHDRDSEKRDVVQERSRQGESDGG